MINVTNSMKAVRKGSVLVLSVTGMNVVEGDFNNAKIATEVAIRIGWDTEVDATSEVVQAVFQVMDDGNYGAGDGIRELLVKTSRKNAWLFPIGDLANGYVEYDCRRKVDGKTEKFAVGLSFEAVIYDSMTEYKKAAGQVVKKAKTSKKALKPKKDTENTDTVEVSAK